MSVAQAGLRFHCTQCGNCCTGLPGFVWVGPEDEQRIADHLGLRQDEFRRRYTRDVGGRLSLIENPGGDCIFLTDERLCSIQPVKPRQCVAFPFWPRIVASRAAWEESAKTCPGMGHGDFYSRAEIERLTDPQTSRSELERIMNKAPRRDAQAPGGGAGEGVGA